MHIFDILHRAVVLSCVGVSIWGIGTAVGVHNDTLRRGRELMEKREAVANVDREAEKREQELAEAAQKAFAKS